MRPPPLVVARDTTFILEEQKVLEQTDSKYLNDKVVEYDLPPEEGFVTTVAVAADEYNDATADTMPLTTSVVPVFPARNNPPLCTIFRFLPPTATAKETPPSTTKV